MNKRRRFKAKRRRAIRQSLNRAGFRGAVRCAVMQMDLTTGAVRWGYVACVN